MSAQPSLPGRLWGHHDFLKLWAGQTVSVFGSLITGFALPLVAILSLHAGPFQVALLGAAQLAPGMLVGLFAGAWVDRVRRKPLMVGADLGRALLLGSVPLAAALHSLTVGHLYVVAGLTSALNVLFEVAYRSYLPSLVRREQLVEGNSKLEATNSIAEVAGLGLAGVLVQLLTAPIAILVDALSFFISAGSLALIRRREPRPRPVHGEPPGKVLHEIAHGLRLVWRDRVLRALAGASATREFFAHIFVAVLTLFLVETLRLQPAVFGFVFGLGGVSAFFGALLVERVTAHFGLGRTMIGSLAATVGSALFIPLAFGPPPVAAGLLAASQAFDGTGMAYHINRTSLVQSVTPERLLGRVNASTRVAEQTATLLGLLVGGVLGQTIGLRPTVLIGVLGMSLSIPWLYFSPIRTLQGHPTLSPAAPEPDARGTRIAG